MADLENGIPVTADTVFTTGSITKQLTAAAVLKLQEAGKLSVSDPITKYFDGVPADKRGITIHHLMSHQAGFPGAIGENREQVPAGANRVVIVLASPNHGAQLRLEVDLEPEEPHRILSIEVEVGD